MSKQFSYQTPLIALLGIVTSCSARETSADRDVRLVLQITVDDFRRVCGELVFTMMIPA